MNIPADDCLMGVFGYRREMTTKEKFEKFHTENPHVYAYLRLSSLRLHSRRVTHWSMRNLWENMRYNYTIKTNGKPFKLDNNLAPFYARMLMEREPLLKGFFETRS